MSRFAILISSPGIGGNVLPGPPHDAVNLRTYLRSPTGGRWNVNEIRTLNNPTLATLHSALDAANNRDYCFFAFSGHGQHSDGETLLQLRPGQNTTVSHVLEYLQTRATAVIDACREVNAGPPAPVLPGFEELLAEGAAHQGEYRDFFEQEVMAVNEGAKNVLYACRIDQLARDTPTGGVFIKALINEAVLWSAHELFYGATSLSVGDAWHKAAKRMVASGEQQQATLNPLCDWRRRPPFAVGMPKP